MSEAIFIESPAVSATALHCSDCDDEGKEPSFHVGQAAIERHRAQQPTHQRIVWLKAEVV